jgi:hypothetical protein
LFSCIAFFFMVLVYSDCKLALLSLSNYIYKLKVRRLRQTISFPRIRSMAGIENDCIVFKCKLFFKLFYAIPLATPKLSDVVNSA